MVLIVEEPVTTAVVAVPLPAMPHMATVRELARTRQEFDTLAAWLMSEESRHLPLHDVEREQEYRGREIQRLLLGAHVAQRSRAELLPAPAEERSIPTAASTLSSPADLWRDHHGRTGCCRLMAAVHPRDNHLQLPRQSFSYELQRRPAASTGIAAICATTSTYTRAGRSPLVW